MAGATALTGTLTTWEWLVEMGAVDPLICAGVVLVIGMVQQLRSVMNPSMISSILVIVLRSFWPLLGGVGVASDDELKQIAGALVLLGSVAYHAWQRHQGQKARG